MGTQEQNVAGARRWGRVLGLAMVIGASFGVRAEAAAGSDGTMMHAVKSGQFRFEGEVGRRVDAIVETWLLRAPTANPGIIDMFHRRDRHLPYGQVVPWAGEFAGKYLIAAVQMLDMTKDPRLEPYVEEFVHQLINSQAEDGYLGPFTRPERLLAHWDLWGHYHCMQGLLMWYDRTGDERALQCVLRAADLMCDLYVGTDRRPVQAGAPETNNLAVMHVIANLYRRTGNPRYMQLVRVIEEDMTTVGDWLRQGEAGTPFFLLNGQGNRWESLHIVQGLAEMYRVTGEDRYRKAVLTLWGSMRRYDRHPSGAFSTFERGAGSVYAPGTIETCCSIAWVALTLDVLELTGDASVADELELTTWNQALAAQHPSGSWCTYDTPLNGVRYPSFHQINFQARPSAPELNCCAPNGPRALSILRSWGIMEDAAAGEHPGVVVNFYGPGVFELGRANGNPIKITQQTGYPVDGAVTIAVAPRRKEVFPLRLRIPAWSTATSVSVNGKAWTEQPEPGTYLVIDRPWKKGDTIELAFDMTPRVWAGAGMRNGQAAVYAGPLLLAYDAYNNATEVKDLTAFDVSALKLEPVAVTKQWPVACTPMAAWKARTGDGAEVVLTDFANAGAHGTEYVAWLPVTHAAPPPVQLEAPVNGAVMGPGTVLFEWAYYGAPKGYHYELIVAKDAALTQVVWKETVPLASFWLARDRFTEDGVYYWTVRTVNEFGATADPTASRSFTIDRAHAPFAGYVAPQPGGPLAASPMDGSGTASAGLPVAQGGSIRPAADRFGAPDKALEFWWYWSLATMRYEIPAFPEDAYTFSAWLCPTKDGRGVQGDRWVFSAWTTFGDDPLRVVQTPQGLVAVVETKDETYTTLPVAVEAGEWIHVAAVKEGAALTLYVDGEAKQRVAVPETVRSASTALGLSSNPAFAAHDGRFVGSIDDFAFYPRALAREEITAMARNR